jgi:sterol desaturase/sphingolipid hydroxylase (fatty acid hydroxylase superfamily)
MNEKAYQAITLVVFVLGFDFLERRRPGFPLNRQRELPLNIMALLIVIAGGELWKTLLLSGLNGFKPGRIIFLDNLNRLPSAAKILLAILLADFCLYWVHRAMHRTRLWRTHTFHHSIEELWWLSGSRTSFTHLLLFAIPQMFLGYWLLDLAPWEAGVALSFGVAVNIWIHTNLWVNLGALERILITPNYHRLHHGARGFSNKNLGFVLTIWDRIFGTYLDPQLMGKDFALGFVSTRKHLFRMIVGF